jgi:hypothetical protein
MSSKTRPQKFCTKCGDSLSGDAVFCRNCGTPATLNNVATKGMTVRDTLRVIDVILNKTDEARPSRQVQQPVDRSQDRVPWWRRLHRRREVAMPSAPLLSPFLIDPGLAYTLFAEFCVSVASAIAYDAVKHRLDRKQDTYHEKEIARLKEEIDHAQARGKDETLQLVNDAIKLIKSIGTPSNSVPVNSSELVKVLESRGWTTQTAESKATQIAKLLTTIGIENLQE